MVRASRSVSSPSATSANVNPADRKLLREQHELLGGTPLEREAARTAILWVLERYRATWNDLIGIISGVSGFNQQPASIWLLPVPGAPDPLELLTGLILQFVDLTDDEVLAVSLWTLHTFLFNQFEATPRLLLVSPVPGCGKTTILRIIKLLGSVPLKTVGISPAAIYHLLDRERRSLLVDEAENLAWMSNRDLRAVIDSGHARDGSITRLRDGEPHSYVTFAPMALASLDRLPLTVIRQSVVIRMKMATRELKRIEMRLEDFDIIRNEIVDWCQGRKLDPDPVLPDALNNRLADNWRVLISIADACSKDWGRKAREVAVRLSQRYSDDDLRLILLSDIKAIFDTKAVDRITMAELVAELIALEGQPWAEYRGVQDDQTPRRLTTGILSNLLRPFGIRSKTIWPPGQRAGQTSAKGYCSTQFAEAWAAYLREYTRTQSSNFKMFAGT
jgi:hypothetical protein